MPRRRRSGVDLEGLAGDAPALLGRHRAERAHVAAVAELTMITRMSLRHREEHLAEVLGLRLQLEPNWICVELGDADQFGDLGAGSARRPGPCRTCVSSMTSQHGRHEGSRGRNAPRRGCARPRSGGTRGSPPAVPAPGALRPKPAGRAHGLDLCGVEVAGQHHATASIREFSSSDQSLPGSIRRSTRSPMPQRDRSSKAGGARPHALTPVRPGSGRGRPVTSEGAPPAMSSGSSKRNPAQHRLRARAPAAPGSLHQRLRIDQSAGGQSRAAR